MPSIPSVPLISARPSFSASTTGVMPAAASASAAGRSTPSTITDGPLAHHGQRAVRERSKITGAAETAVLVDDRGEPRVQQIGVRLHDDLADSGTAGRQGGEAQQHQGPDDLGLHLGPEPAACERIRLRCSWVRIAVGMCRVARAPKPVETP